MRDADTLGLDGGTGGWVSLSGSPVRWLKGRAVEPSWWHWELLRLALIVITAPAVVAAMYLIFRKRRP
jgi:hypothetical protein